MSELQVLALESWSLGVLYLSRLWLECLRMSDASPGKSGLSAAKGLGPSGVMLIGANLIPLAGVLGWDWSVFHVVVVYWLENVIIGVINILKMIICSPDPEQIDLKGKLKQRIAEKPGELDEDELREAFEFTHKLDANKGKLGALHHASKLFFIPFFTFHYGLFCLVHGVFVFALLGKNELGGASMPTGASPLEELSELLELAMESGGQWAALGLVVSHLFSFCVNYLGKGEYRRTAAPILMIAPYGRIVVLHLAIIFGAFATILLGSQVFLLVILIIGKIMLDLKFHRRAHKKFDPTASETSRFKT